MSAWTVSHAHIDVLVLAGLQFGVDLGTAVTAGPAVALPARLLAAGVELWAENHRSVGYRYDEHTEPPAYTPPTAELILDPVAVVKAVDCYVYQSSEHPGWNSSRSAGYCTRLRSAAMTGLPPAPGSTSDSPYPAGWDEAPWGIANLAQAAIAAAAVDPAAEGAR